ncbi:MAG: hypothetical protein MJD61_13355 [Proteobacteria bacterium]|nr:hypothetical protein [Pseudomonadota bacterium]
MTRLLLHTWLPQLVMAACWLTGSQVAAQGWLADRSLTEGQGIRAGNLELHPGIGTEVGYDSNVFRHESDPISSPILRVSPHLDVSTLGQQRSASPRKTPPSVSFRGGIGAQAYLYLADYTPPANFEGDLSGDLVINPERPFSLALTEHLIYGFRPFGQANPRAALPDYRRIQNLAGARAQFASASGMFRTSLGYTFGVDRFVGQEFRWGSNLEHDGKLETSWSFLPFTTLLHQLQITRRSYSDTTAGIGSPLLLSSGSRVSSRIGLHGAITRKLSLTVLAGYAAGFYALGDDFDDIVGQLELRWSSSRTTSLVLGYDRGVFNSFLGNFRRIDKAYAKAQALMGGRFLVRAEVSGALHSFGAVLGTDLIQVGRTLDRLDPTIDATLFAEYRAAHWFGINTSLAYQANLTDYEFDLQRLGVPTAPITVDPARFNRLEAWLGLRVFY